MALDKQVETDDWHEMTDTLAFQLRGLMRRSRHGALATLDDKTGHPIASLVAFSTAIDGAPLLLLSDLAAHTRNLKVDARVSLLVYDERAAQAGTDPLTSGRLTVVGTISRSDTVIDRRRYLAWHPPAAVYSEFSDFAVYRIAPEMVHSVAGFGRIYTLPATDIFLAPNTAAAFEEGEESAIDHMNADHRDAIQRYAAALPDAEPDGWRMTGCDPDGVIICRDERAQRLAFPEPVTTFNALRTAFGQIRLA